MKRLLLFLLAITCPASCVLAANCSSLGSGNWNAGGTWSCGITPTAADTVTINNTHNVSLNGGNRAAFSLVINNGGTLTTGSNNVTIGGGANTGVLTVNGNVAGNGNAASRIIKNSTGNLSGTGTISNVNDVTVAADTTLPASTNLTFQGNECRLDLSANVDMINNGTLTFSAAQCGTTKVINLANPSSFTNNATVTAGSIVGTNATGSIWTNAANSTLQVTAALLATGRLNASANGNTVHYNVAANQAVKLPFNGDYFDLTLSGGNNKTPSAGTYNILNDLTINTGVTFNANTNDPIINVTGNMAVGGTYTSASVVGSKLTISGDLSVSGTFTGGNSPVDLAGDFTRTGTYTTGNGIFTFNGVAQQTIAGATTFANMEVDGAGVLLGATTTVSTTLTLTNGLVETTAAFAMLSTRACNATPTVAVARTNGWVNGNLVKTIPNNISSCTFEVGDDTNYAPAVLAFVAGTGTGLFGASTTGTEHPQIESSGIDGTKSVNRYWTLTNVGVTLPVAGYSAVFNFVNGSPVDFDSGANTANFIIERFTSNVWFAATLGGACTPTPATYLCKQATGLINAAGVAGEFAIGEPAALFGLAPGDFSIFETTTPTGLIQGRIYTKLAGTTITLAVQAVNGPGTGINAAYNTNPITVALLDSTDNSGAITAATNCRATWTTVIQTQNLSPTWTNGRATITITAPTSAGRDVRVRVTQGALQGCSTDRFSIRPGFLRITSSASNPDSTGGTTGAGTLVKTGADFTITAQALRSDAATAVTARYTGTPAVDNSVGMIIGSPNAGTIGGTFNAATGISATNTAFWYTEVGNFGLAANAVVDAGFTTVDQSSDCTNDTSTTLVGGKYGCSIGSLAVPFTLGTSGFGRFIPDNFDVTTNFSIPSNTPSLAASCGTFTYMGQAFFYNVEPVMTVTARNGTAHGLTNATTRNYAGAYVKVTNTSLAPAAYDTQDERYQRFDTGSAPTLVTSGLPAVTADPVIAFPAASLASGVGTLTFKSGTGGLTFTRGASAPSDAFNADISLELNVVDTDAVAFATNPAKFGSATSGGGISFNGNKPMRYGRLRMLNASGPATVDIPITLRAEYYVNAATGFTLNTADSCTPLDAGYFKLSGQAGSLTGTNMGDSHISVPATLTSGIANGMKLLKASPPTSGTGSVRVCFDLDSAPGVGDTSCQRSGGTSVNLPYLQGPWTSAGTYDKDPIGQVNVGTFGAQPNNFIFFRENY